MTNGGPPLRFYSFVLAVADLPLMREWYGRVLGLATRLSGASQEDGTAFVVMEGAGTCIELIARLDVVRSPPADAPDHLATTGWRTLDLETDDLAALDMHLRREGVTIIWSMRLLSPRRAMTMVHDPEGNAVAFFGPPPP